MIVPADIELLNRLRPLGEAFALEAKMHLPFDWNVFRNIWGSLISAGTGHVFCQIESGEPIGAIGLLTFNDPFTGALTAQEAFWFVRPEARGTGLRLLQAAEAWCRNNHVRQFLMVALTAIHPDALERLYSRMGFTRLETVYYKDLACQ